MNPIAHQTPRTDAEETRLVSCGWSEDTLIVEAVFSRTLESALLAEQAKNQKLREALLAVKPVVDWFGAAPSLRVDGAKILVPQLEIEQYRKTIAALK